MIQKTVMHLEVFLTKRTSTVRGNLPQLMDVSLHVLWFHSLLKLPILKSYLWSKKEIDSSAGSHLAETIWSHVSLSKMFTSGCALLESWSKHVYSEWIVTWPHKFQSCSCRIKHLVNIKDIYSGYLGEVVAYEISQIENYQDLTETNKFGIMNK